MLVGSLDAHRRQLSYVESSGNPEYLAAYNEGKRVWIKLFGDRILYKIIALVQDGQWVVALGILRLLLQYDPQLIYIDREVAEVAAEALCVRAVTIQLQQTASDLTLFFNKIIMVNGYTIPIYLLAAISIG